MARMKRIKGFILFILAILLNSEQLEQFSSKGKKVARIETDHAD
jgi:hypothetical protein